ncbi:AAA family ATPase [Paenibacillus taichungensis]|uniref:AAA family ATPase n=1 Tax=Paenibacillus taichungensis TaxID=484184 RepID=A0ABX2MFW4_9BACL|nr:restriction endonuclease [Paenibacillus taichungensis]NUU53806.1 AAA family ATPase [Paenibacillus taichungensis]
MPNYDFHNCLSPREFEELVRDIIQIKEQVPFEISGRGKDGGVDLRYWEGNTKIIVQVKCYQNNYNQLFNVLKNQEKQKAKALEPSRYILVTSVQLELTQRHKIFDLFDGVIARHDDIIDRVDLNNLLGNEKYHNVERTHYKLWISSTNVITSLIDEVVHRDIFAESRWELEEIQRTVKVFVQNPSFGRAITTLEKFRYVLISGEPGIGKTTLGRCLAAYFLQRKGYNEFIYADTVGSALRMYKEQEKQVFFFDDFWGDIFKDEKLPHNEEKHLLKFIHRISNSTNKILILTSREYVLQQGITQYQNEQLKRTFNIGKCLLQLKDYSDLVKTKILFNHLYFSRIEWDYVKVIAHGCERIINHSNYNPRIVETFLDQGSILYEEVSPSKYYNELLNYLRKPLDFWKSIFMKQTYGSQLTALILFLSSQPIRLSDLKLSYYSCIEAGRKNNIFIQEFEFESIVAQLEKTMIMTYLEEDTSTILVKFQNPSIKDFLYSHLVEAVHYYGSALIQGSPFINQLLYMFKVSDEIRGFHDEFEGNFFFEKRISLPKNLEKLLIDKLISEFDTLRYSYAESNIYEGKHSVNVDPRDCMVRKLHDILFVFDLKENNQMGEFIKNKIHHICLKLHEEEYPLSYDDMVDFPFFIKAAIPLKINLDRDLLINNYYKRSRFAEHLLVLNEFEEIYPDEFDNFKKTYHRTIKSNIRDLLLDDIDFFASNMEYDRIDFLIDIIYPRILESYNLPDSNKFYKILSRSVGPYENDEYNKSWLEEMETEKIYSEEEKQRAEELLKEERESLIGVTEEMFDEDIIEFIKKNAQTKSEALELISVFQKEEPWYIYPFFRNWNRLSLLLAIYHQEKNLPLTSASFYEKLFLHLINQITNTNVSITNLSSIVEIFCEFAFDMMEKGQFIFSEQTLNNHLVFKDRLETSGIDLNLILSCPFIVQRGKWYEFQTLAYQVYLSLKNFLRLKKNEGPNSYSAFLELKGPFVDIEHDIWLLCSELDLQNFNRYYLVPLLKEYLEVVDPTNAKTVCTTTFKFFRFILTFKIPQDTLIPEITGSTCNGIEISALEFIGQGLLDLESFLDYHIDDNNKDHLSHLLRLSNFILQQNSPGYEEDEYELDFAEHGNDPELLKILESLGVCEFLLISYQHVLEKVKNTMAAKYNLRLDSYLNNLKTRRFALVD